MVRLWEWFEHHFGALFTEQYADHGPAWKQALNKHKITPKALKYAMSVTEKECGRYPPNLNQFLYWCRAGNRARPEHMLRIPLHMPDRTADLEKKATEALSEVRAIFERVRDKETPYLSDVRDYHIMLSLVKRNMKKMRIINQPGRDYMIMLRLTKQRSNYPRIGGYAALAHQKRYQPYLPVDDELCH